MDLAGYCRQLPIPARSGHRADYSCGDAARNGDLDGALPIPCIASGLEITGSSVSIPCIPRRGGLREQSGRTPPLNATMRPSLGVCKLQSVSWPWRQPNCGVARTPPLSAPYIAPVALCSRIPPPSCALLLRGSSSVAVWPGKCSTRDRCWRECPWFGSPTYASMPTASLSPARSPAPTPMREAPSILSQGLSSLRPWVSQRRSLQPVGCPPSQFTWHHSELAGQDVALNLRAVPL